jgi:hypothetical protein
MALVAELATLEAALVRLEKRLPMPELELADISTR